MGKKQQRFLSNKEIVCIKIGTACMLFLASSMFFFGNFNNVDPYLRAAFRGNLANPLLLIFYIGNILVAAYVILVMIKLWDKDFAHADKFDLTYRITYSVTLISMAAYSFFTYPYMMRQLGLGIMVLGLLSGIIMWATPKILDNDNEVF